MSAEKKERQEDEDASIGDKLGLLFAMGMDLNADLWGLSSKEAKKEAQATMKELSDYLKTQTPGFFSPINSKKEFALVALTPIASPVVLGLMTGISALGTLTALLASLTSFAGAAGFWVSSLCNPNANAKEHAKANLHCAARAGVAAGTCLITSLVSATLMLTSSFIALTYLIMRSGATLVSKFPCKKEQPHEEQEHSPFWVEVDNGHYSLMPHRK